ILNEDGQTTSTREKILTITVGRGWREGTKVRFTKEGDQGPNRIPCDIVFVIKDLPHSQYHREGNNLIYQPLISLVTALTGGAVELLTLDNRLITVPITDVIYPGREIRVVGEGMPLVDDPNERGDLIIRFNVSFPAVLNPQQKQLIKQALVVNI
ncbi:PREDICTED: dnaJ homolog subfamily B member 13-like, partial [Amphimedon queenslandica]